MKSGGKNNNCRYKQQLWSRSLVCYIIIYCLTTLAHKTDHARISFSHAISLIWAKELDVRDSDVLCFRQWREFWAHNPRLQTPGLFKCLLLHYYTLSFSTGVLSDRAPLPSWATCVHDTASLPPLDPNLPEAAPSWASTAQDVILIHIFLFGKKKEDTLHCAF